MTTLIDELLAEQQQLTAVERFARRHELHALPLQARYYRELIPLEKPQPGQQYAFAVDLDLCTGCKACVSACHSLNGLDDEEIWRNVGSIHGGTVSEPYQQTVTTACHHCVDPGCLSGCPVAAYEKDPVTGIVRHLDDQCIGCEYCMLKCPYDVPKYSPRRGIVRKCDMCSQRLAANEAPACVQACPSEAIAIRIVDQQQVRAEALPGVRLLPGAFESSYTRPTTLYTSKRAIPLNAHPGDVYQMRLEHPHWPLIWMLLLSQLAAGLCLAATLLPSPVLAIGGFAALQAGLVLSVFHLGQPFKAWRFFLGLRTSWMSREILVFSMFAGAASLSAAAAFFHFEPWAHLLAAGTAVTALAGIFCSAMIYIDTRRPFWSASMTLPKFFGTTLVLGVSATGALLGDRAALAVSLLAGALYAVWEAGFFFHSLADDAAPSHRSARTVWHLLRPQLAVRGALLLLFAAASGAALFAGPVFAWLAFIAAFGSALVERYCFFTASDAPRMPGGIAT